MLIAGLRGSINGSEHEDRFAGQGQSHTFQSHDERHRPIAMRGHKLLQVSERNQVREALNGPRSLIHSFATDTDDPIE
jgi:hypothetical protein